MTGLCSEFEKIYQLRHSFKKMYDFLLIKIYLIIIFNNCIDWSLRWWMPALTGPDLSLYVTSLRLQARQWSERVIRQVTRPDWQVRAGPVAKTVNMVVTPRVVSEVTLSAVTDFAILFASYFSIFYGNGNAGWFPHPLFLVSQWNCTTASLAFFYIVLLQSARNSNQGWDAHTENGFGEVFSQV